MKRSKILVLMLALVLAFSAVALCACGGGKDGTAEGEYSYFAWDYTANKPGTTNKYGCKVTVTVEEGKITQIKIAEDTDTYYNLSANWGDKDTWTNGANAFTQGFVNMTPADVMKIKVATAAADDAENRTPKGQPSGITGCDTYVTGATQSSGRFVLALQNALSKLGW
ncbi:MAG: FMN-binding protein [Corallococcus sp.]|nr:FMN-binding protein [Corallococcus sp.]